jgi:hypothetical protein
VDFLFVQLAQMSPQDLATLSIITSVIEPHHIIAAPDPAWAPGKQKDAAPAPIILIKYIVQNI